MRSEFLDNLLQFSKIPTMFEHDHSHGSELSGMQLRVRALETILVEKGYVDPAALDRIVEACETKIGPYIGACIIEGVDLVRPQGSGPP